MKKMILMKTIRIAILILTPTVILVALNPIRKPIKRKNNIDFVSYKSFN